MVKRNSMVFSNFSFTEEKHKKGGFGNVPNGYGPLYSAVFVMLQLFFLSLGNLGFF